MLKGKAVSRREFLKYAGITGAAVAVSGGLGGILAACGDEEPAATTAAAGTTAGPTTTAAGPATTAGPTTTVTTGPSPRLRTRSASARPRPISGVNAVFEQAHFGPAYKLWVDDVNTAGGLEVAGKKLPIEMIVYDDQSDMDQSMRLLTKLMEEDKVDFVFAPCSTAFLFAAAGVANAHELHPDELRGRRHHPRDRDEEGLAALVLPVPELLEPCADARVRGHLQGTGHQDRLDLPTSTTCTASSIRPRRRSSWRPRASTS